jgi:NAD(P)-dependent dehydrogenase (short-subunit alcohol dehydrogenase family)
MMKLDSRLDGRLDGRVALVTGGAKRLGRAIALELASAGADIALHYFQSQSEAKQTKAEIEGLGRRCELFARDLRQGGSAAALASQVLSSFAAVDLLINNASSFPSPERLRGERDLLSETEESWRESFAVNAEAPFFLIQALAPSLSQSGNGVVINLLDTSVQAPWMSRISHTLSKRALREITLIAAKALAPHVRVNALVLGKILPPDSASSELRDLPWSGTPVLLAALSQLVTDEAVSGEVVVV